MSTLEKLNMIVAGNRLMVWIHRFCIQNPLKELVWFGGIAHRKLVRESVQACRIHMTNKESFKPKHFRWRRKKKFIVQLLRNKDILNIYLTVFFGSRFLDKNASKFYRKPLINSSFSYQNWRIFWFCFFYFTKEQDVLIKHATLALWLKNQIN